MSTATTDVPNAPVDLADNTDALDFKETFKSIDSRSPLPLDAQSQSIRSAARLNAAYVSDTEYQHLLGERGRLIKKKYQGGITEAELSRLEYVRWSLDRIEDARHGETLDRIEDAVFRYKRALAELQTLRANLASHLPKGKR